MTNKKLIEKLQEDMEMRGFSHYTKDSYLRKTKVSLDNQINNWDNIQPFFEYEPETRKIYHINIKIKYAKNVN